MAEQFGRYELLRRLSGGATGDVFLARQEGLAGVEKLVILKTLAPRQAQDERLVAGFLDEARIGARLHHPNVCQVVDLGRHDGALYVAREYVHGVDLARLFTDLTKLDTTLPVALAVRLTADVAAGLHHAHELTDDNGRPLEIVHRALSPSNILVSYEGGVKLGDFGLARAPHRLLPPQAEGLEGTVAYMAPEQMNGGSIDRRVDVFSLGVVLYELLTGRRLFLRPTDRESLAAVLNAPIEPPSRLNEDVPPALEAVVLQALARDPEARFQTARAFQQAMEAWLRDARDPSTSVHLSKFVRQLYAEQLAAERRKGLLWDAPEAPVARAVPKKRTEPPPPRPAPVTVSTVILAPEPEPPLPRRRWPWGVAATIVAALLAGLIGWATTGSDTSVHFLIESEPTGARVLSGDDELGVTPFVWRTGDVEARKVRLDAAGHDPVEVEFTPDHDGRVKVRLPVSDPDQSL